MITFFFFLNGRSLFILYKIKTTSKQDASNYKVQTNFGLQDQATQSTHWNFAICFDQVKILAWILSATFIGVVFD